VLNPLTVLISIYVVN